MAAALFESFGCETTRPASGGGLTYLERMTEDLEDGTHVTLGLRFRTPAHPHVLAALGRALYCFLSLEESVTAILFDAGAATLPMTRAKMAGDKEQAIVDLADRYRSSPIVGREVKPRPRLSPAVGAGMRGPRWVPRSPALHSRRRHVSTCRCWAVWSLDSGQAGVVFARRRVHLPDVGADYRGSLIPRRAVGPAPCRARGTYSHQPASRLKASGRPIIPTRRFTAAVVCGSWQPGCFITLASDNENPEAPGQLGDPE